MADPTLLYVSDDPEKFLEHGRLFHAALPQDGSSIRFLFDHVNGIASPMRVMVFVTNVGATPSVVTYLPSVAGPGANGMNVGHEATIGFLQAAEVRGDVPITSTVGAGAAHLLASAVLSPGDCYAGILDLAVTSQTSYEVRVVACDPGSDDPGIYEQLPESPTDGAARRGIFNATGLSVQQALAYVGARVMAQIGAPALPRSPSDTYGGPDYKGVYGIVRRFMLTVDRDAVVYQSPRAGAATASYVIEGQVLASHQVGAKSQSKVAPIAANQGPVSLATMPEINSSYPLNIIVDADDSTMANAQTEGSPVYLA